MLAFALLPSRPLRLDDVRRIGRGRPARLEHPEPGGSDPASSAAPDSADTTRERRPTSAPAAPTPSSTRDAAVQRPAGPSR